MTDFHVYAKARVEAFRGLEREIAAVGNDAANVIRQAAVGIRNMMRAFKYRNLRLLIQTADAGSCCGAAGYSANNNDFHKNSFPDSGMRPPHGRPERLESALFGEL